MMTDTEQTVDTLTRAADQYYNEGSSFLSDAEYDALERQLRETDPTNPFLIGVGSEVRGDKVKLPFVMGSLNAVNEGDTAAWIKTEGLGDEVIVVTSKEDGVSIMLVYGEDGNLQIAFSRGNGIEGQDVTRHVRNMKNVPQKVSGKMAIRAEVIMSDTVFEKVNKQVEASIGRTFANPRNYVAGQMNASTSNSIFYDNVSIIAYEIISIG